MKLRHTDAHDIFPTVYTFGSPRVGNTAFATCISEQVPMVRFTHRKDNVVHFPFEVWGYQHSCREAYDTTTDASFPTARLCNGVYCDHKDDPHCAAQWDLLETSQDDHNFYLGIHMYCASKRYA